MERMLEKHPAVLGGPEPHLLTPLAHLGVWANVEKAPYDHVLAVDAQRGFVERLPRGYDDYWAACRAYADTLYGASREGTGKSLVLDKTPAYALILPFLERVFPDAKYIVLTRHPAAIFSSYANSFFDGDFEEAHRYNPILKRYVPAIGKFLRETETAHLHIKYEELVTAPEDWMRRVSEFLEIPFEPETVEYGSSEGSASRADGLGDPIGVNQHTRPTDASVVKWADELAASDPKRRFLQRIAAELPEEDLVAWGYPAESLWEPLNGAAPERWKKPGLSRYRLQRKAIVRLRSLTQRNQSVRKVLRTARLGLDVLLRE